MPKLCKFTSPADGKPVYVNPEQVAVVYQFKGQPADTIIAFGKDFPEPLTGFSAGDMSRLL